MIRARVTPDVLDSLRSFVHSAGVNATRVIVDVPGPAGLAVGFGFVAAGLTAGFGLVVGFGLVAGLRDTGLRDVGFLAGVVWVFSVVVIPTTLHLLTRAVNVRLAGERQPRRSEHPHKLG